MSGTVPVVARAGMSGNDGSRVVTLRAGLEGAGAHKTNSLRAMQHVHDLSDPIQPWRRATIAVSAVATIELIALAAIAFAVFGNPLASHLRESAAAASTPPVRTAAGDTPRTLIMYRPGYVAEGKRLGHDLHIRIVRPLDGMHPAQLLGAHLVLILGR